MIRSRVLQFVVILLLLVFVVNTGRQLLRLNQAKAKLGNAEAKLENLRSDNAKLKKELDFRQSPDFVEEAARNQLGLVKEGETLVILPKNEAQKSGQVKKVSNLQAWFKRLFD